MVKSRGGGDDEKGKGIWRMQDDSVILNYIYQKIMTSTKIMWPRLASQFISQSRTSRSCNERWVNQLDPVINRSQWSEAETHLIYVQRTVHNLRWI